MFSGAKLRRRSAKRIQGITGVTQEDNSIYAALAWLSASMTALQKGDRVKEGSKKKKRRSTAPF